MSSWWWSLSKICSQIIHIRTSEWQLRVRLTARFSICGRQPALFRTGIRWNICVPDATDMLWVLKEIDRVACGVVCS
ncbi:hypothetical protein AV903_13985 [Erwinia tracheiphila]|uniref:Uncharacterized protein n=1 Tax=Erwinia tracheiphila TaxID=65700 RepID=A0A345CTY8_9GAMM|nr:hypothetical protein AV903_13985 [Erwinia tracheiphila]